MNTRFRGFSRRLLCALSIAAAVLVSGCLEKRLIWSPDGNRAAVIAKNGALYLCDRDGNLATTPLTDVALAEWAGGSQRLIVARRIDTSEWSTVAPLLGDQRQRVEAEADRLSAELLAGKSWAVLNAQPLGQLLDAKKNVVLICLRERHSAEIKPKLTPDEWHGLSSGHTKVSVTEVQVARVADMTLTPGAVLCSALGEVVDLRASPDGRAVALSFSTDEKEDTPSLQVLRLDEPGSKPVPIARFAAAYPDWTKDGRSLVYVEAPYADAKSTQGFGLGVLTKREVIDGTGRLAVAEEPSYSAVAIFSGFSRVRCLADGRILFNSAELTLPLSTEDLNGEHRDQLFAVDPGRQATLVRLIPLGRQGDLPQMLSFFEVSPDGGQVVFGGLKSETVVFTVATGAVEVIQGPGESLFQGTPTWRGPGELCYVKRMPEKDDVKPARPAEIVIRSMESDKKSGHHQEVVLSKSWSDEVLAGVASEDRR